MNRKTNLILLVLVLIAVGYLLFVRTPAPTKPAEETASAEAARKLFSITAADVTKLVISPAADKQIVLEKKGDAWEISEPVKARADRFATDDLVNAILELKSRGQVSLALDEPRYRLEITAKDGKTTKLAIGSRSALGDTMYVQLDDAAKLDVVPADLDKRFAEPVSKLRDAKLVDANSTDIRQLVIDSPSGKIAIEKAGEAWRMTKPQQMPVETMEVTDITAQLSSLRATEFVNEDGSGAPRYQLAEPQLAVWFSKEVPATQPSQATSQPAGITLKLGRYDGPEKRNLYAMVSTFPGVVKVPATILTTLKKKPFELRDRKVVEIPSDAVSSIAMDIDIPAATQPTTRAAVKTAYTVKRNPAAELAGPPAPATATATTQAATAPTTREVAPAWLFNDGKPADETRVKDLLAAIKTIRANKYLETLPEGKASATYALTIDAVAAGGGASKFQLKVTDRGESESPIGQYNGLVFEMDREILGKLALK